MAIYINHAIKWLVRMRVQEERQDLMVTDRKYVESDAKGHKKSKRGLYRDTKQEGGHLSGGRHVVRR